MVTLHYGLELSFAEMSQVLDLPLGTVKSRIHEALSTLRTHLGSEDAVLYGALSYREGNSQ